MSKNKYLITQTLLSAYEWVFKKEDGLAEFVETLERKKQKPTQKMLDGINFENMVQAYCCGEMIPENHKWYQGVCQTGEIVKDSVYQAAIYRDISVNGIDFLVYGKLDFLKAGHIYDTKFSKTYKVGKYLTSPQHSIYLYLCPDALDFTYVVCDGQWVYKEMYTREDCTKAEQLIYEFMQGLEQFGLVETYIKNWEAKR